MRRVVIVGLATLLVIVGAACGEGEPEGPPVYEAYPPMEIDPLRPYSVTFTTSVGRISFQLFPKEAPLAVNSFIFLANEGYFDGVAFHRVVSGVLAETGDATGTGTGNPGYTFEVEPPQRPYARGGIALVNDGTPNSTAHGSSSSSAISREASRRHMSTRSLAKSKRTTLRPRRRWTRSRRHRKRSSSGRCRQRKAACRAGVATAPARTDCGQRIARCMGATCHPIGRGVAPVS